MSRLVSLFFVVAATVIMPRASVAEETILDPENPAVSEDSSESEQAESDDSESEESKREAQEEEDTGDAASRKGMSAYDSTQFGAGYTTGLWVDTRWDRERNEDVVEWTNRANLHLKHEISERWSIRLAGQFYHWMGGEEGVSRPRATAEVRLGESYALYQSERVAFRVGHLVTSWGSTDLIRPGDVVNPVDAREFAGTSAQRGRLLPQPAVELSYLQPNWSLTGVVVPFFRANRFALFGRDSALLSRRAELLGEFSPLLTRFERLLDRSRYEELQPIVTSPSAPDEHPANASLGLRWTGTRWNTDVGVGYFWGWDRTPSLVVDSDLEALGELVREDGEVLRDLDLAGFLGRNPEAAPRLEALSEKVQRGERLVEARHERQHTLLFDVARYVGPIGLRADVALQPERTYVTQRFDTVRRPTVFGALGASYERLIGENPFAVTVEGFWLEPLDAEAAPTEWFVAEDERGRNDGPLLFFDDPYRGIASAVNWSVPWQDLELRVGGLVEIDRRGVIVDGSLSKRWASWLRTSIGGRVYEGPRLEDELSLGGFYDPNDQIGITVGGAF